MIINADVLVRIRNIVVFSSKKKKDMSLLTSCAGFCLFFFFLSFYSLALIDLLVMMNNQNLSLWLTLLFRHAVIMNINEIIKMQDL